MCHTITLFMVSTLLLNLVNITISETVYFAAPDGDPCSDNVNCHSINQYTNYTSNSIYYLLKGNHTLEGSSLVTLTDLENVTFQGKRESKDNAEYATVKQTDVKVTCTNNSGFLFDHLTNVVIRNVTILNCGGYLTEDIVYSLESMLLTSDEIGDKWMKFRMALFFIETTEITLDHVSIQHSKDYGLVTANAYNLTVTHSSFAFSNVENYNRTCMQGKPEADNDINIDDDDDCFGGNAFLFYSIPIPCSWPFKEYVTTISSSNFSYGYDSGGYPRYSGSGLNIYMEQRDAFGVNHIIEDVVLYNNTGRRGANFRYTVAKDIARHSLKISSMKSSHANHFFPMSNNFFKKSYGAGMYIDIGISGRRNMNTLSSCFNGAYGPKDDETTVSIINTVSTHNIGAFGSGLYLSSDDTVENQYCSIIDSTFDNNSGFAGAGMLLVQENNLNYKYILENVSVSNSRKVHLPMFGFGNIASAVMVRRFQRINFQNIQIQNNPFTGLFLLNSQVYFTGEANNVSNNTALFGGGVQVHGDSCIFLQAPVRAFFEQNKALRTGGAIFVQPTPYITAPCFFQPYDKTEEDERKPMNITFTDNSALMGGDVIYGARLNSCYLTMESRFYNPAEDFKRDARKSALEAFYSKVMINSIEDSKNLSVISSDPFLVCICQNNTPNCSTRIVPRRLFPGGTLMFSMVAVGERQGTAPGFINMEALVNNDVVDKAVYSSSVNCTNLNYTVGKQKNVTVNLNYFINLAGSLKNLSITVEVSNCPKGFELGDEMCDCNEDIMALPENVTCNQTTTEFWHSGRVWIGYDNSSSCFATASSCYNDYCINEPVSFTIDTQDRQCQHGRTGIGCGRCIEGYSLILGCNECRVCTNNYLSLLLLFAFAGIGLVLLLLSLNLTVSFGTINGLIFYANIVKVIEPFLFPEGYRSTIGLLLFISWINLDFGIPTCFTSNLTAIYKTFLQLVFPFYLWFIMLVIAVMVHFSSKLTQFLGRKIIPTIATLLLLSFMKLLRACLVAWIRANYTCNSDTVTAWRLDSTVIYHSQEHLAIFLTTMVLFSLLIVPYTLSLVFSPLIERYLGHFKMFSWWVKLKPFIDAYDGPYRDKYRYWTGLLLLVRVILVPVFAYNPGLGLKLISFFAVILLSILSLTSGLYRHKALDALEIWFIFQVYIVTSWSETKEVVYTSLMSALVTFVGIIVFHILYQLNLIDKIRVTLKQKWSDRAKVKQSIRRNLSAYTRDLLASAQRARNVTSVKVNPKAKYVEEGTWVVNKRETLLRDYDDTD